VSEYLALMDAKLASGTPHKLSAVIAMRGEQYERLGRPAIRIQLCPRVLLDVVCSRSRDNQ